MIKKNGPYWSMNYQQTVLLLSYKIVLLLRWCSWAIKDMLSSYEGHVLAISQAVMVIGQDADKQLWDMDV